jgi:hypothetical protein
MHDVYSTWLHVWPISVRLMRDPGEAGRANRGSTGKHTASLGVQVGGVGIHWQTEDRPTHTRAVGPATRGGGLA